ncbi:MULTISPECIES: ribosome hibernation promoting factor [Photobacterium]|uniref:Ribosome hibernation promoting factor n=2 Tax=Photobacterium angustum TaxID=661 RepID=A0A0D8PFD6_PHOAN|nr:MULTISPECIES: ribosome hibernation promoting factor [Photobacterium]KJF81149.1 ribosome hibernation promoting factor HPF [Photobacterium damselae subsp. damselae]EAS63675.1 putative sigma-54 modulation protein [Vibrio angustum S14] [Photobacterium angustum S14]KJF94375.1 ribosome hibernation promoting factor HPF [Photobacterium angustum]KJG01170.1 ribosome hibernation promoting factor HPF [Photobacterium angustum]KJG05349.1 ribosome hibernation promoting factor HPF [Photobacterium angustum]
MQINITGHHVDVTDSLREYVTTKFEKLERFFDKINNVQVILNVEKLQQIAEATLHINAGEIHAKADSENMYAAIDELTDKLVRQLNKHKDKLNSH